MSQMKYFAFSIGLLLLGIRASQSLQDLADILIIFGAGYVWFFKKPQGVDRFPRHFVILFALWFLGICLSSIPFFSQYPSRSLNAILEFRWVFTFMGLYIASQIASTEKVYKLLLFISGFMFAADLIYHLQDSEQRLHGFMRGPMALSHTIAPIVLFLMYYFLSQTQGKLTQLNRKNLFTLVSIILGLVTLILTLTRGVWFAFAAATFVTFFYLNRRLKWTLVGVIGTLVALMLVFNPAILERIRSTDSKDYSKVTRSLIWRANLELFKEHPVLGVGYSINNELFFQRLTPDEQEIFNYQPGLKTAHAHNQYIHYAAGTGIWGLACYLVFLGFLLFPGHRLLKSGSLSESERYLLIGLMGAIFCFAFGSLTEANFSHLKDRQSILVLAALLLIFTRKAKKTHFS